MGTHSRGIWTHIAIPKAFFRNMMLVYVLKMVAWPNTQTQLGAFATFIHLKDGNIEADCMLMQVT